MRNLSLLFILIITFTRCGDSSSKNALERIIITEKQAVEHGLLPVNIELVVPSGFTNFISPENGFKRGFYVLIGEKDTAGVVIQQIDLFSMPDSLMNGNKWDHLKGLSEMTKENFGPGEYKQISIENRKIGRYEIPLLVAELDMNAGSYQGSYIYTVGVLETNHGEKVQMSSLAKKNKLEDGIYSKGLLQVLNSLIIR
ncbi:hypothetical protein QWY31_13860 [Cytophagales bacterium LB-30]|uniref:Lipoprotein n=1 Tax=Shiella aurantiaca TaxID=3058365 RepID=A0ABT8F815_9BACT|nr:hypothetical protein [Shiella aurantiaca]MDN4166590.1 hypothetical protein [Shiella aurantiaca]